MDTQERYEVEVLTPEGLKDVSCARWDFEDLDDAAIFFYRKVAEDYREPSIEVALHDCIAGETLASFQYDPDDAIGKVEYDITK